MLLLNTIIFAYTIFSYGDASFVDTLKQCSYKDNECLKSQYESVFHTLGKTGLKDLDIPIMDPMKLNHIELPIIDMVTLNFDNGTAEGLTDSVFNDVHLDLEKKTGWVELTCSLTIKGDACIKGKGPVVQKLMGTEFLEACGEGVMKLDDLHLKYEGPIVLFKKADGKVYMKVVTKDIKYTFDVKKVTVTAKNYKIGDQDISPILEGYMNSQWQSMLKAGDTFLSQSMEDYHIQANKFFSGIPMNKYISEDLSSFVEN